MRQAEQSTCPLLLPVDMVHFCRGKKMTNRRNNKNNNAVLTEPPRATRAGAFGVVSAGVHLETGEVVAIKQIPRSMIQPTRLQAEVDLLRMAGQHKNVVNFRDLFSDDKEYYIVMGQFAQDSFVAVSSHFGGVSAVT